MSTYRFGPIARWTVVTGAALVLCMPAARAHGPGGDSPGQNGVRAAEPRLEARSELFELVARLGGGELSVMINRFETNEPVLDARVEVAMASSSVVARFHADHGDYAVEDASFIKALSAPGEHALVFTILAGRDSDLLEGTLAVTPAHSHEHGHSHWLEYTLFAGGALAFLAVVSAWWRRRARSHMTAGDPS